MKPQTLSPLVLAKLGFANPLAYEIKPDGKLVILDKSGRKYTLPKKDYEPLLESSSPCPTNHRAPQPKGRVGQPVAKPGRKPKQPSSVD